MANSSKWFQGYFTTPGSNLRFYEGDGLSNRLVATFERAEDAAEVALLHNEGSPEFKAVQQSCAAPDMAEALRMFLAEHDNTYDGEPLSMEMSAFIDKARAALAKAGVA